MGQKILEKHLTKEAKNSTILHVRKGQWGNLTKIGPEGGLAVCGEDGAYLHPGGLAGIRRAMTRFSGVKTRRATV